MRQRKLPDNVVPFPRSRAPENGSDTCDQRRKRKLVDASSRLIVEAYDECLHCPGCSQCFPGLMEIVSMINSIERSLKKNGKRRAR